MDDLEDIKQKLADAGIPVGGWVETKGGERPAPPSLMRQRALLEKLRDLIKSRVEQDQVLLSELHETANRIKHGGGR